MLEDLNATTNCSIVLDVTEEMNVDSGLVDQTVVTTDGQDACKNTIVENVDRRLKYWSHDGVDKSTVN